MNSNPVEFDGTDMELGKLVSGLLTDSSSVRPLFIAGKTVLQRQVWQELLRFKSGFTSPKNILSPKRAFHFKQYQKTRQLIWCFSSKRRKDYEKKT
jgi:hypothetical protein